VPCSQLAGLFPQAPLPSSLTGPASLGHAPLYSPSRFGPGHAGRSASPSPRHHLFSLTRTRPHPTQAGATAIMAMHMMAHVQFDENSVLR
jgi:hypothetical protein